MRYRVGFSIVIVALLGGQAAPPSPPTPTAFAALDKGRYLEARAAFAAAAFNHDGTVRDEGAFQAWSQFSPMVTGELPIDALLRDQPPPANNDWANRMRRATPHPAIAEIVRRARLTSIVILNEAHDTPRDRAFALQVARALRPLGYATLAAETFNNNDPTVRPRIDAQLAADGFARFGSGTYLKDPVFATYVREAIAIGYRPVAYEKTAAQRTKSDDIADVIATREEAQTKNLIAAIFTRDPHAKVLIHVGYSHAAEAPITSSHGRTEWMAARLKRATGIDPLTIDQTTITDTARPARDAYRIAADRIGDHDAIFFDGDRPLVLGPYEGAVDVQVIHPARRYRDGRPTWRAAMGGHSIAIPPALVPASGERLIQVFAANAPADAVPLDQVLVTAGQPVPRLFVPPVPVRFATQP